MKEKYKCILDECNNQRSIYRVFCSKDCEEKFFKKYPSEIRKNDKIR